MVTEYLKSIRNHFGNDTLLHSVLDSGKKVEEESAVAQKGTPEYKRDRLNQMIYLSHLNHLNHLNLSHSLAQSM